MAERRPWRLSNRLSSMIIRRLAGPGLIAFVLVAAIVGTATAHFARSLTIQEATGLLAHVNTHLDAQAELADLTVRSAARAAETASGDALAEEDAVTGALGDTVAWVLVGENGDIITSSGSEDDVRLLASTARERIANGPAFVMLPGVAVVVAASPIANPGGAGASSALVAARAVDLSHLTHRDATYALLLAEEMPSTGDGWTALGAPGGFTGVLARVADGRVTVQGTLATDEDAPQLAVELSLPDPWLGENIGPALIVFLAGIVVVILAAVAAGLFLGRTESGALAAYADYVRRQGQLALQGQDPEPRIAFSRRLPAEMADLGDAITTLLTRLRRSQTELIAASEQSASNERAFRTVVEESPELKILVRNGVVEVANPAAAHFFGLRMGDLANADPEGLFAGVRLFAESGEEISPHEMAGLASREEVIARCVMDGQPDRWVAFSIAQLDGEGDDYVFSARNITEERRVEALRAEVRSLVSHDLRSPLTVVRGYLDILEKPLDVEQRQKALDAARRSTAHMEQLLDDLLQATRAESVLAPRVMRPVDLGTLATGIAAAIGATATQGVVVSADSTAVVLGDPDRLRQAITNLLSNATKYSPDDGTIRVSVEHRDGRVIFGVQDDGPGLPESEWEKAFERGVRGDMSAQVPGSGLGLYIVRIVAESHGGRAYIEEHDGGVRFVLELPTIEPAGLADGLDVEMS